VQEFIRTTFQRVFREWEFDYIKIDFLTHGALEGRRADPAKTGIEAFRIGMRIIREEAGPNRFILNCGSPLAASIGLCDGMRIGMDVGGRWFAPMNLKEWRFGNCCIKGAANSTVWRQWMHNIWWHNDPDCIVLRSQPVPQELEKFMNNPLQDREIGIGEFGLNSEETGCWLRLVWLSGGMFILSEDAASLSSEDWQLLSRFAEPSEQPVRWVEQYGGSELGLLRTVSGPLKIGLFNLSDQPVDVSLKASALELDESWRFSERLSGESFCGAGNAVDFPVLPPHSGRIWEIEPA
jgi:alpha-galactosidase